MSADGVTPEAKRLPKAIQCILSNYRGAQVDIPEADVGDVMVRLGIAAKMLGKMPCQNQSVAAAYREAHRSLQQLEIGYPTSVAAVTSRLPSATTTSFGLPEPSS